MRVGIVYGGTSEEASASHKNALSIESALRSRGYDVCMIEYARDMIASLRRHKIDIVYVCVQGKHHGDGTLQAMLEHEQIPYTGSCAEAAMLINNKILCKMLFEYYGIPTPRWRILHKDSWQQEDILFDLARQVGYPLVAKAPTQGGSFGIEFIRTQEELYRLESVFEYDNPILLEEFIDGRFYTVGVLEKDRCLKTLKCVEGTAPVSPSGMVLFTGEYGIAKPDISKDIINEMEQLAAQIFGYTNARDVARVDFMVSEDEKRAYVLEINAVPGLKRESLLPLEAGYCGIKYEDLIEDILLSAWHRGGIGSV